eukprot:TRINITY_DN57424_c0_g1_i1.p1 TRINITY_DN57424_c0_g1~~TRINITY_DN57424_c0_g1_i1.p1  ORF type:complete len:190 (+),score=37.21 TRINITY_DN57424_c0_g1_i1:71-571(+)
MAVAAAAAVGAAARCRGAPSLPAAAMLLRGSSASALAARRPLQAAEATPLTRLAFAVPAFEPQQARIKTAFPLLPVESPLLHDAERAVLARASAAAARSCTASAPAMPSEGASALGSPELPAEAIVEPGLRRAPLLAINNRRQLREWKRRRRRYGGRDQKFRLKYG